MTHTRTDLVSGICDASTKWSDGVTTRCQLPPRHDGEHRDDRRDVVNPLETRIRELLAENERLRQHLSASDGAEREWHNLATKGVTASAKWKSERDALQARVDAATEVTEEMLSQLVSGPERRDAEAIHEALTGGGQPPEPKPRCCIGPFADGTHAVNCWQRCQDCGGDDTTCHCREAGSPTEVQP